MALAAHIAELAEKHRLLERKIEEEVARPGSDDIEIHRLKLEKLKLKDQIARLSSDGRDAPLGARAGRAVLARLSQIPDDLAARTVRVEQARAYPMRS